MNDVAMARRYISKFDNAEKRGIEFELSFSEFKRLSLLKRCAYSGLEFNTDNVGFTQRTLDRVDNSLGYVNGNVVAVCNGINQFKSIWENPNNPLTEDIVEKIMANIKKRGSK